MTIKLIVFDCDGTLIDSQASIVASMQTAFDACGLQSPSGEAIRRIVGLPLSTGISILADGELTLDEADTVADAYREAFAGLRRNGQINDPLYDGIIPVIDQLDGDGWLLGVATGKGQRGLRLSLEAHGLSTRFVTLQTADNNPGKPDPAMLVNAMAEAGATPDTTVMIGDTTFDMEMSRNAGTLAIGVAWGYHEPDELLAAGAAAVLEKTDELIPSITNLSRI